MRFPMPPSLLTRISDMDRDRRNINGVYEKGDVIKRPGVVTTNYNYANHQGALGMQGYLITIYDDTLDVFDYVPMPPPIYIGDLVGGYYAMVDNPSTSPGGGDDYWSATPPGADRFRCVWNCFGAGGGGGNVIALSPTTPNYMIGDIAASSAAAAKVWVENSVGANLAGIAALDDTSSYSPDVVASSYLFNSPTSYSIVSTSYVEMSVAGKNAFLSPAYPGGWPSGVDWTSPTTFNKRVGLLRKRRTTTSFTLTSSGTTCTLTTGALLDPYQLIEISGCNEPEYNGTFYAVRQLDSTYPWLSANEWKFTLSGTPAASPATGSKSMTYYGAL